MAQPNKTTPSAPAARPPRRSFKSYFGWSIAGALAIIALYTLLMLTWSYSEGERAGVLQKFSKRGWICKTYEGELALYVVGGIAPQIWDFSVRDAAVAEEMNRHVGKQVRLHYEEHRGLPTSCFGDTDYFVDGVEVVAPPQAMQPSSGITVAPAAAPPAP
jgi:hypothetical protein